MMHFNFLLAALFVVSVASAPVHTNLVPSPPSPQVTTTVPTTVTLPVSRSVPSSVWQYDRRILDQDAVRPPPAPAPAGAQAVPLPPVLKDDKTLNVRATKSIGAVTTVTLPLPTATAPHAHRADVEASGCDGAEVDAGAEHDLHARMLALPIKGLQLRPHATTTLNSVKARQLLLPTAMINAVAKVPLA